MNYTDEEYIREIKQNNESAVKSLYKIYFPMVRNFILKNNGSEQEAKDIYQESFIIFYNNIIENRFSPGASIKTYLYSICRRQWLSQLKEKKLQVSGIEDFESFMIIDDNEEAELKIKENCLQRMEASLEKLGEPCRSILTDYYFKKLTMQEIAGNYGYTDALNAKTQKYKCLQRLKRIFFEKKIITV
ncbi:MAG: sigma-70 family RNA polymerase sigma factor [Bacteroidia bacterium]|nr:sigma-70 family RNA polymerase sigma factor [Bacteroidia bacterium]